jgi:hypothetical protein
MLESPNGIVSPSDSRTSCGLQGGVGDRRSFAFGWVSLGISRDPHHKPLRAGRNVPGDFMDGGVGDDIEGALAG